MIKIGVCDDNLTLLNKYKKMIENSSKENGYVVDIIEFSDGTDVIDYFKMEKQDIDILFLDVLMENISGIKAARQLRELKSKVTIIFLTSSEEFIFESMDVNAYAYLMKDQLTIDIMYKILRKSIEEVKKKKDQSLNFKKNGEAYQLSHEDISFIKIYNGFCYIHHWDGIIFESSDLSIMDNLDKNFIKIHSQYIINLHYIGRIEENQVTLSDTSFNEIPLDEQYEGNLKLRFAKFMMEKM